MSVNKRPSTSSLRRYLTFRPYIAIADIRRRFGLEPDAMSLVTRNGTTAYVGLPEREATKLQDLWQRDEVGVKLSVEVHAPVLVGIYPMRISRFVDRPDLQRLVERQRASPPLRADRRASPRGSARGMRVGAVISDLMLFSRIDSAARSAGAQLIRTDTPTELPEDLDLILVDWSPRRPGWADALRDHPASRTILFGHHTDLEAHADARAAGLGPMWARSKLVSELATLLGILRR